jgi:hypothetical protein
MTIIAVKDGLMASDSRSTGDYIQNVTKVVQGDNITVGWSGDWVAGYAIAEWIAKISKDDEPPTDDCDVDLLVMIGKKLWLADQKMRMAPVPRGHFAIGSGAIGAMVAMNLGLSAEQAVKEVIKVDESCGGRVKIFSNG